MLKYKPEFKTTMMNGMSFKLPSQYVCNKKYILGAGSFGVVIEVMNSHTGKKMAIKKICNNENMKNVLRELIILRLLKCHENIINLSCAVLHKCDEDIYLIMDFMECDLGQLISSPKQEISILHIKHISHQILKGLAYMHDLGICHRDLKPKNILMDRFCNVKIADLGMSRFINSINDANEFGEQKNSSMTENVTTRAYQAPCILINAAAYDHSIDLWSFGCILAELFVREPIFQKHGNQLQVICQIIGLDSAGELGTRTIRKEMFNFVNRYCIYPKNSVLSYVPNISDDCIELLEGLLILNPDKRFTAKQAISNKFYSDVKSVKTNLITQKPIRLEFAFEDSVLSRNDLWLLIEKEVLHYGVCDIKEGYENQTISFVSKSFKGLKNSNDTCCINKSLRESCCSNKIVSFLHDDKCQK